MFNRVDNVVYIYIMKASKQLIVKSILDTGLYSIDIENGLIYSIRKRGKSLLSPLTLPTGYQQLILFKGRGTGVKSVVYVHQIVYMAANGLYNETLTIDHIDGNKANNKLSNLRLLTQRDNGMHLQKPKTSFVITKTIRSNEIKRIRELMALGLSQSKIAIELGLNRLAVRYIVKKIQSGKRLKYE